MKNFLKKHFFLLSFIFIFILIEAFQLTINYKENIKPPSNKWSKGVLLSEGNIRANPIMISIDENYLIAHDDGNKIKLILTDKLGSKIKEKEISTETNIIKTLILSKCDDDIYINWLNNNGSKNTFYSLKTNKNFEEKDLFKIENVSELVNMDKHSVILGYPDKIESLNLISKEKVEFPVNAPSFLRSYTNDKASLITYKDGDNKWFYLISKDKELSSPTFIMQTKLASAIKFLYVSNSMNSNSGHILIEYKTKDESGMFDLAFPFNGDKPKLENLQSITSETIYNIMPYNVGEEIRYLGSLPRYILKKNKQPNIIDFTLENLYVKDINFVSKTITASKFVYPYKNMALYGQYVNSNTYKLYLTSTNEEFKEKNNFPRDYEKKLALSNTMYSLFKSISFIFTWGFVWLIFGCVIISLFSFFSFMLKDKTKQIVYINSYLITAIIKLYYVYKFTYIHFKTALPSILSNPIIGLSFAFLISILCLLFGYKKYSKDLDSIPASSFIGAIITDTILTQMIFVPFVF